jgi:hypothetical protein
VISTLNVQHLESLYDTVEQVTGVKVRERIPDRVVAEADQIVNVDITTEDLRHRLEEGKVYTTERIETALTHFFRQSNLEQLRELTLRELAAQIDSRHRAPRADDVPSSPDQVMVCLSSRSPNSEALLRYASRLAGRLNRNWYAVYVQTASESPTKIDSETQRVLSNALTWPSNWGRPCSPTRGRMSSKRSYSLQRNTGWDTSWSAAAAGNCRCGSGCPGTRLSFNDWSRRPKGLPSWCWTPARSARVPPPARRAPPWMSIRPSGPPR